MTVQNSRIYKIYFWCIIWKILWSHQPGIYITENLKWNVLFHSLCSSWSIVSYTIKSLKAVLIPYMPRTIYFAYFQTRLRYEIILWGGKSESNTAFQVQKRVICIISGTYNLKSCRQIIKACGILTVNSLYILDALC